ncbi:VVA0879 family protein [uncultured Chryseobacterium sp.]|uniref:VVA0879 family protein n=1 Tax=uncultured Chryseobacterium sp. TaxID=259322 RepID=UPI0025D2517B|nr:VVA0879 family protein [uncultured Chryseobacterium sp.]
MGKGFESLEKAVMADCTEKKKCTPENKCEYCRKKDWVLDRAAHYAEKTGKSVEEILDIWEEDRGYWYMNYYQDANQPLLDSDKIIPYDDWIAALKNRFGEDPKQWRFKCVSCGGTQSIQDFLDNKVESPEDKVYYSCIGRYVDGRGCDWTLGGLFTIHKISVLKSAKVIPVFEMADVPEENSKAKDKNQ